MTDDPPAVPDDEQLRRALAPPPAEPPPDRVDALRRQVLQARGDLLGDRARPNRRRVLVAAAAVGTLGVGAAIGALVDGVARRRQDLLARGTPEFEATLVADGVEVQVTGAAAPEGRIVVLRSQTLPVLPAGEYYELWFSPVDGDGEPISAGTFHPDADGGTVVVLHAAVDPRLAGRLTITHETGDGGAPSEDVVATGDVRLL